MNIMKKISVLLVVLLLLCGCQKKGDGQGSTANDVTNIESSRSVMIADITGDITVTHSNNETLKAYEGMNLYDGDDIVVGDNSNLTLNIDSDKHVFAEPNSHFWLTATGSEGSTKTTIHLQSGSVLCDINNKLNEDESFDIQTASSTMSVRGTVFRVCLLEGNDKSLLDLVEVYDGKVWSSIENTDDDLTLEPGQCALIRKTDSPEDKPTYITEKDIDENFIKETGLNISLENADNGGSGALKISLDNVPIETLGRLITIIDEGTELAINKEEITNEKKEKEEIQNNLAAMDVSANAQVPEVVEEIPEPKKVEEKPSHSHNLINKITKASDCSHTGLYDRVCSDCGEIVQRGLVLDKNPNVHVNSKGEIDTVGISSPDNINIACQGNYYKDRHICESCGAVLSGQLVSAVCHVDSDSDNCCDYCGGNMDTLNNVLSLTLADNGGDVTLDNIKDKLSANAVVDTDSNSITSNIVVNATFKGNDAVGAEGTEQFTINIILYSKGSLVISTNSKYGLGYSHPENHGGYYSAADLVKNILGLSNYMETLYDEKTAKPN